MQTGKKIYELHEEHKSWLNKLAFYTDEVSIMQNRLGEVAKKNSDKDILVQVERFQNRLLLQKEQIDILSHDINGHESHLESRAKANTTAVDHEKFEDHDQLRDRMDTFEKLFNELRGEQIAFLAKWM